MHQILKAYLRRLTNLSGNNKSLMLLRLLSDQFVDLSQFEFIRKGGAFNVIEQLIAEKPSVSLCKLADSRDQETNQASLKLKRLYRLEKFIEEERGSKDLYVGWPFIRGKFANGTMVRCPLLFFPVRLEMQNDEWVLMAREEESLSFNKSFLLAYGYYNNVKIEEDLLEKSFDDFDKDSRVFRTALYQLLKESSLELNFNQENFIDKLSAFENFKRVDYEKKEKEGELKLYPEAVLGIFPQAGSYLVPDYDHIIDNRFIRDIEEFFASRNFEDNIHETDDKYTFLKKVKEEQTFTPFKMDAFQENAIKAVKKGNSVVVQGPPGTGKSQMICNLISDFIARGKRVLLVCQKKAALDVVYERLKEKDVNDFIALVHDFKNDRKEIYEQIKLQIDKLTEFQKKNNSLDAIQLERKFIQTSRRIDQITEELEEYKFALFDESECGLSAKELYLTSGLRQEVVNLRQEYKHFHFNTLDGFIRKLEDYITYYERVGGPSYVWNDRKSFKDYSSFEKNEIIQAIEDIGSYQEYIAKNAEKIIQSPLGLEEAYTIKSREMQVQELIKLIEDDQVYANFCHMVEFKDAETDTLWLSNIERIILDCYSWVGPEISLKSNELGEFQKALYRCLEARKGLIKWLRWKLFSKEKNIIAQVLKANGLTYNRQGLEIIVERIDNRLNLEHNLTKLKANKWLSAFPVGYQLQELQNWFSAQKKAIIAKLIFSSFRNFKEYFNVQHLDNQAFKSKLVELLDLIKDLPQKREQWLRYLTPTQVAQIPEDPKKAKGLLDAIQKDFEHVCQFDQLKAGLEPYEAIVIDKLFDEVDLFDKKNYVDIFQNSLRIAWIEHIEIKYPVLRHAATFKFDKLVIELQECMKEKAKVSKEILLLKTRERTYQQVEYNRLSNMVTYRDLYHQVTKKKKIWPLRKLIYHFDTELFNLLPCWMASPETVSAVFPMEEMFDLVIFDEASQCFAEKGIPAMYRGKQIVVTGDDKQLKPNDLYQVRWEEDTDDVPELEAESLLALANRHLKKVQLRGHYRSRSLDLIGFSNKHFYNGDLRLIPDYKDMSKAEPGISYIKVDGVWENNTNKVEAEKVVELIGELTEKYPEKSIGVITFNARQQDCIMDTIDQWAIDKGKRVPSGLFVKNIENVQGDERDIIIFSTAYAPDQKGNIRMQFGSLNDGGGENRLNVAVTRARYKIFMVCSIFPEQLNTKDSKNEGPKLFQKYLAYALDVSEGRWHQEEKPDQGFHTDWFLKNKLLNIETSKKHFTLSDELPFADVTIKKDGKYWGSLLTDDDLYFQSVSVKDAHVYRPFALSGKNWRFQYFHSREYWDNADLAREKLMRFIHNQDV
jgi:DNA polymerase IIIc chi subunit